MTRSGNVWPHRPLNASS